MQVINPRFAFFPGIRPTSKRQHEGVLKTLPENRHERHKRNGNGKEKGKKGKDSYTFTQNQDNRVGTDAAAGFIQGHGSTLGLHGRFSTTKRIKRKSSRGTDTIGAISVVNTGPPRLNPPNEAL